MQLNITERADIGTHFNIERLYLGTVKILNEGEILYKVANVYVRFVEIEEKMCAILINEAQLKNIVPIIQYYQPKQLLEAEVDGGWIVTLLDEDSLNRYNKEYNY